MWVSDYMLLAVAAGLVGLLAWTSARPVRLLAAQVDQWASTRGDLSRAHAPASLGGLGADLARLRGELVAVVGRSQGALANEEAAAQEETEFLRTLNHELRTPLNAIIGFTQVLLDGIDGPLTESQREDLQAIRTSGDHLRALVDDVLDLAALQSGRISIERSTVEMPVLLGRVVQLVRGLAVGRPVRVETRIGLEVGAVVADERRLEQILVNLGTNALKFTERGSVVFEAARTDTGIRLSVRDTGVGIARSDQEKLFIEFSQVGPLTARVRGSGLGLAICRRLTELHGGRIWVESTVGQGSAFHVDLPAEARA